MEITPINHYNSHGNSGGGSAKNVPEKQAKNNQIKDSYEPSARVNLGEAPSPAEIALVMEKIKVMPEIRANLLIQAKDEMLQGKYNEPEIVGPIAESLIS